MVQTTTDVRHLVDQCIALLSAEGISVERVLLYGSYARGTAHEGSDVDIVVISKDFAKFAPFDLLEFLSRIAWKCDGPLEVIGYTPDEVRGKEGNSIFWDEICKTGRVLYEAA